MTQAAFVACCFNSVPARATLIVATQPALQPTTQPTTAPSNARVSESPAELVKLLASPDAAARERAIRLLVPHAKSAAAPVVELLTGGKLSTRVAAIELLRQWGAPADEMDAWDPATLTKARMEALAEWARNPPQSPQQTATPAEVDAAVLELPRYLAATEADAALALERLARVGPPLFPAIEERERNATEQNRRRLALLRYRLVITDARLADWPQGPADLASPEAEKRRAAATQLADSARPDDSPLLAQIFRAPDPLVREIGLRALQRIGGDLAAAALRRLLVDPEPNVRAAVLNHLAQTPNPALNSDLLQFVKTEKDTDLVIHGIRALRVTKTVEAAQALIALSQNPNWRVRGEAVDAIKEHAGKGLAQADSQKALLKALEDSDGFVVGRAVLAIQQSSVKGSNDPLAAAAEKHPDIAADVIKAMYPGYYSEHEPAPPIEPLLKFAASNSPRTRSVALVALSKYPKADLASIFPKALKDPDASVRLTAANAIFDWIDDLQPKGPFRKPPERTGSIFYSHSRGPTANAVPALIDHAVWIRDFQAGKSRAAWLADLHRDLEPMLANEKSDEQVAAALVLCALGHSGVDEKLLAILKAAPAKAEAIAPILHWLPVERRAAFMEGLVKPDTTEAGLVAIAESMARNCDEPAIAEVWKLLARPNVTQTLASAVFNSLQEAYGLDEVSRLQGDEFSKRLSVWLLALAGNKSAPELQRLVAMATLVNIRVPGGPFPPETKALLDRIFRDESELPKLRADAFQSSVATASSAEAKSLAIAALQSTLAPVRKAALVSLASQNRWRLAYLRENAIRITPNHEYERDDFGPEKPLLVTAPKDMKAEDLLPLLNDPDPLVAAYAGYFLAILKDKSGWKAFNDYAKSQSNDDDWRRLRYRAISVLNDDALVPDLELIYTSMKTEQYYIREFYWTIRPMTTPLIYPLRKKIRDEMTMNALR